MSQCIAINFVKEISYFGWAAHSWLFARRLNLVFGCNIFTERIQHRINILCILLTAADCWGANKLKGKTQKKTRNKNEEKSSATETKTVENVDRAWRVILHISCLLCSLMISLLTANQKGKQNLNFCRVSCTTRQHSKRLKYTGKNTQNAFEWGNSNIHQCTGIYYIICIYWHLVSHLFSIFLFFLPYSIGQFNKFQMKVKIALCRMCLHRFVISWAKAFPGATISRLLLNAEAEEESVRPRMNWNMYLSFVKETNKNSATTGYPNEKWKWKKMYRLPTEREERRKKKSHTNPKERNIHVIVMHMHKNTSCIVHRASWIIIMYVICDMWYVSDCM